MKSKKAQYFIREYSDRPVNKREFLRLQAEEMQKTYVEQKYVMKHKIVSLAQIRAFEKSGLKPVFYARKKYFNRDELAAVLVINRSQRTSLFEK